MGHLPDDLSVAGRLITINGGVTSWDGVALPSFRMMKRFLGLILACSIGLCAQTRYVKSFNSIADMVAANPNDVTTHASVKYSSSSGSADSGGEFYYDATSVAATNTTTVFKPTNYGGRWIRSADPSGVGGAAAVPTGTGFRHVTANIEDATTKLVDTSDINPGQVTYSKIQDVSATQRVLGRNSVGVGPAEEVTLTQLLDWSGGGNQGAILYRGAASWTFLNPGTSGLFLKTQGGGADPVWDTVAGSSSVSYVNGTSVTLANFNNSTPAAVGTGINVTWQIGSSTNISAYIPAAGAAQTGVVTFGTQTFGGNKTFNGSVTSASDISGNTLNATNTLYIGGASTLTGTVTASGALNVSGQAAAGSQVISNLTGPGIFGRYDSGVGQVQKLTTGTGIAAITAGGTLDVDFSTIGAKTNANGLAIGGLILTSLEKRSQAYITTNTYTLDFNSTNAYRIVATNNVILSFANVPTATNAYVGPIIVTLTNAVSASTNTLTVNWPNSTKDDWIEQQDPSIINGKIYQFEFWWNGYEVKGKANGPRLQENEYTAATLSAVSASTNYAVDFDSGSYGVIVATANVNIQYSTNRVATEYATVKTKQLLIRASGGDRTLTMNSSHKLVGSSASGTVTNGTAWLLSFTDYGPSETNVFVGATYAQ